MLESPLVQHFIQQAETRAKQETVLKLLRLRFDSVPESITEKIASIQSFSRLDTLFENAVTAETLNEFETRCMFVGAGSPRP